MVFTKMLTEFMQKNHMQSSRRGYTHSRLSLLRQTVRPRLSCGFVCVILCLAVSVEHRLVTETDTTP